MAPGPFKAVWPMGSALRLALTTAET